MPEPHLKGPVRQSLRAVDALDRRSSAHDPVLTTSFRPKKGTEVIKRSMSPVSAPFERTTHDDVRGRPVVHPEMARRALRDRLTSDTEHRVTGKGAPASDRRPQN